VAAPAFERGAVPVSCADGG